MGDEQTFASLSPIEHFTTASKQTDPMSGPWFCILQLSPLVGVTWQVVGTLERNLAATRSQMAELSKQLDEEKSWMALLESPQSRVVELHATPQGSAELAARVIFDPVSRRALVVCDRFTAPAGKDYQLWAIGGGGLAGLGLVRADAAGHAVIRVADAGDPVLGAFAVSFRARRRRPDPHAPPRGDAGQLGG
jgi:hypothetical protein